MSEFGPPLAGPCKAAIKVNQEGDFALNQKIEAPAALSASERASARALAELAEDQKRALAEDIARPVGSTDFSADNRRTADLTQMTKLLTGKAPEEMDRMIAGADQLLGGTSLKLARAGSHVWIGDKDFGNEKIDPAQRRYTPATMILGWTPADTCPVPPPHRWPFSPPYQPYRSFVPPVQPRWPHP